MVREILLLGDPRLYQPSEAVRIEEIPSLRGVVEDLHDTLMDFRQRHGVGRAIAAPQIGVFKRLIYMNTGSPVVLINPVLRPIGSETMELWDDCMSFPDLLVRVRRWRRCTVDYLDMDGEKRQLTPEGDLSELLQHEYDHLDGILATMRAIDSQSLCLKSQRHLAEKDCP